MFQSGGSSYPKNYSMVRVIRHCDAAEARRLTTIIPGPDAQTVGVDFSLKAVTIPDTDTRVELFLFDCAGQSTFNQREYGQRNVSIGVARLADAPADTDPHAVGGGIVRDGRL